MPTDLDSSPRLAACSCQSLGVNDPAIGDVLGAPEHWGRASSRAGEELGEHGGVVTSRSGWPRQVRGSVSRLIVIGSALRFGRARRAAGRSRYRIPRLGDHALADGGVVHVHPLCRVVLQRCFAQRGRSASRARRRTRPWTGFDQSSGARYPMRVAPHRLTGDQEDKHGFLPGTSREAMKPGSFFSVSDASVAYDAPRQPVLRALLHRIRQRQRR
jgi:hypothetical protein